MSEMMQLNNATITKTGLQIREGINFEEWEQIGKQLGEVKQGLLWWIGDWCNYGERSYGEKYSQAMEETGKSYGTIKNAAFMSRRFPPQQRDDKLTYSHYAVVAGLPDEICDRLLTLASDNDFTVKDLKEKRYEMEDKVTPKVRNEAHVTCPECGHNFEVEK